MRRLVAFLVLLCPASLAVPGFAQNGSVLYSNGLPCPDYCHDAWEINNGYAVSDTFVATADARITGFDVYTWENPGDKVLRVQWAITSSEFGGTLYGSGTVLVRSDVVLGVNEYGYDVDRVTVSGLNVAVPGGTSWLTLQNVVDVQRLPVYWDENSGIDCNWPGCPSLASENQIGTIPSESFDLHGAYMAKDESGGENGKPLPTSGSLWSPLLLGVGAAVRRLFL